MVKRGITDREDDLKHPVPPKLSVAYCGQNEGSKKTENVDEIFWNVWKVNSLADANPEALRISMDTKATVHIGEYSRNGRSRGLKPVEAWDHDMRPKEKLIPGGILEPVTGKTFLFFTRSLGHQSN